MTTNFPSERQRELLLLCCSRKKAGLLSTRGGGLTLGNEEKVTLTLVDALAELLTEILAHHTRAGAVARMVGVITWLVFAHLVGQVIWSNRATRSSDWHSKLHHISKCTVQ